MAFVYRYLLPKSETVVYIGKTSGDDPAALKARISAHANEDGFKKHKPKTGYVVQYIDGLSAADADILETALINENDRPPQLNRGKTNWGRSGLVRLDGLEWKTWSAPQIYRKMRSPLEKWAMPGHPEALYACDCCGRLQKHGDYNSPRYVNVEVRAASGYVGAFHWLCDECSEAVLKVVNDYIDSSRQRRSLLLSSVLGVEAAKERPCERCEPDTGGRR